MTDKKKPSWFQWLDLTTLAPGVLTLSFLAYAIAHGAEGPKGWQWGTAAVGLAFIGIWLRLVLLRRSYLAEFRWYPTYGIMAHPGQGYSLPSDDVLNTAVRETMNRWALYYPNAKDALESDIVWVFFKRDLDESTANRANAKVNGLTFARSHTMQVDYDAADQPLAETAFEHELGHVIMGFSTDGWDQAVHHAFMADHGLK